MRDEWQKLGNLLVHNSFSSDGLYDSVPLRKLHIHGRQADLNIPEIRSSSIQLDAYNNQTGSSLP